jgi:hypothetical protein
VSDRRAMTPEDVAGLVERLERALDKCMDDDLVPIRAHRVSEAASTIRALVAENERLKFGDKQMQGLWAIDREERDKAEAKVTEQAAEIERLREWVAVCNVERKERDEARAKLRKAVEVMRLVQHQPMNLEIRAFLTDMEEDSTSE